MRFSLAFGLALVATLALVEADKKLYTGYKVHRVHVTSDEQAAFLAQVERDVPELDFWTPIRRNGFVDVMTYPGIEQVFTKMLAEQRIDNEVMIQDVQKVIDLSTPAPAASSKQGPAMDWESYHDLNDIYEYLDYIEATYDYASTEEIGTSYEGRPLRLLKICSGQCGSKPAMWIDGAIHSREWVSPASVTWFIDQLTVNFDSADQDLLDELDWYILPIVNPDGYVYTFTDDRLWRKTRSVNDNSVCFGTDGNRNWDYHWAEQGSSDLPCSDTYHGPSAFSESETTAIANFITNSGSSIEFLNSLHSYSQLVLLPWGYTSDLPSDYQELYDMAIIGRDALTAVYGTTYAVGNIADIIYPSSGSSADWAHGVANIKYAYGMELRDEGQFGFLLPANQIIPTAIETWAFHTAIAREIIRNKQ